MYQPQEQLVSATRTQLENAMQLADVALRGFEQVMKVHLSAARDALAESTTGVRALAVAKEAKDVAQMQERFVRPNVEKAQAYAAELYGVAANVRQELDELVRNQISDFNRSLVNALDQAAKAAPKGADPAVSALRSALVTANAAAENINRLSKEIAASAEANVTALLRKAEPGRRKAA